MIEMFIKPKLLPYRVSSYSTETPEPERRVDHLNDWSALDAFAREKGIDLDKGDESVESLDARLALLPPTRASELLKDIAVYLGETVISRAPTCSWLLDENGYPTLDIPNGDRWDVIKFCHWREEGAPSRLLDGVLEIAKRGRGGA
ncbi:DUF6278 family protein [Clavibacter sp. km3a]|uniref:DUF6278 family protein n=1 Tax=Clavibacter sp. km3a TaxID=3459135 RepID=UPI004040F727